MSEFDAAAGSTVCFVIPTRDRCDHLEMTLDAVGRLDAPGRIEALVVDNGSAQSPLVAGELANGALVRLECLPFNEGAAARNRAIGRTRADWLVMLDDDSHPTDNGLFAALDGVPEDVWAVSADIRVPGSGAREMGGLPEVFIGCGVAVRRVAFERLGGYDAAFGYYAEEYDLSARIIGAGGRVRFDPRFRVEHRRATSGRDIGTIVERLVRNNAWVMQRYAPESVRRSQVRQTRRRCRYIAEKEGAMAGYARGLTELRRTLHAQERTPLTPAGFDRFTGMAAAREALGSAFAASSFRTACVVDEGKNAWCVRRALAELGVAEAGEDGADTLVIGTMSPGPMIDALERWAASRRRVIAPWTGADDLVGRMPGAKADARV
jgi:GT2 family glycosyltransferase